MLLFVLVAVQKKKFDVVMVLQTNYWQAIKRGKAIMFLALIKLCEVKTAGSKAFAGAEVPA